MAASRPPSELSVASRPGRNEDTGTWVPFETQSLRAARIRADERHGLAMVLRNFAASASIYVLPWASVPSTIPMSRRDLALHRAVGDAGAGTIGPVPPRAVLRAARSVAASGEAGPEAMRAEQSRRIAERALVARHQAVLLLRLLLERGTVRGALGSASSHARAIAQLSCDLLPIGLGALDPQHRAPAPIRDLHREMEAFRRHLDGQLEQAPPEWRAHYRRVSERAGAVITLAASDIAALDARLADLSGTIADWPSRRSVVERTILRLERVQDGWEPVLDHYATQMADWTTAQREHTAAMLAALMPGLPNLTG